MSTLTHPAIGHRLTASEAHAVCAVLHAVERIDVEAHVAELDVVYVWAVGEALPVAQEVTVLRAFCAVTDAVVRWVPAVA